MKLFIQQLGPVVLAMDVQKFPANLAELGHGDGTPVYPAGVLPLAGNLPLEEQVPVLVRSQAVFQEARQVRRDGGELRADEGLGGPGADEVPGSPAPQDSSHGVNDNGFARPGLARKRVESRAELNIRFLDNRNIFDVQKLQHGGYFLHFKSCLCWHASAPPGGTKAPMLQPPVPAWGGSACKAAKRPRPQFSNGQGGFPGRYSMSLISWHSSSAASVFRITKRAVSSPAREPTMSFMSILSRAEQAPLASPGIVLTTTMFWA